MFDFIKTVGSYVKVVAAAIIYTWFLLSYSTRRVITMALVTLVLGTTANVLTVGLENLGPALFGGVVGAIGTAAMFYFWPPKDAPKQNPEVQS